MKSKFTPPGLPPQRWGTGSSSAFRQRPCTRHPDPHCAQKCRQMRASP